MRQTMTERDDLVERVKQALDAELGRQDGYVGELWDDGEIVLDGTFDLNALAEAAIRAATKGDATDWIGRQVRRTDDSEGEALGPAIVLAVDDDSDGPSAWIKYPREVNGRSCPSYRSVNISDLELIESGSNGDEPSSYQDRDGVWRTG